jgi:excisionase family DNA binding protein
MPSAEGSAVISSEMTDQTPVNGAAPATEDRLWGSADVATYLGVSVRWVDEATRRGELPDVSVGRFKRFRPEAIRTWALNRERAV